MNVVKRMAELIAQAKASDPKELLANVGPYWEEMLAAVESASEDRDLYAVAVLVRVLIEIAEEVNRASWAVRSPSRRAFPANREDNKRVVSVLSRLNRTVRAAEVEARLSGRSFREVLESVFEQPTRSE